MNMRYGIIDDGKVIVSDENGNLTYRTNNSLLPEILVSENLIEAMEDKIQELESLVQYANIEGKEGFLKGFLKRLPIYITPSLMTLMISLFFQSLEFFLMANLFVVLPMGVIQEYSNYHKAKVKDKKNNAQENELDYLYKALALEKENLVKLKAMVKSSEFENEPVLISTKLVQDEMRLLQLKEELSLYYEQGYQSKEKQYIKSK